jgi:mannose-6-phosphate isomerase-like protein (cupin superfamily)
MDITNAKINSADQNLKIFDLTDNIKDRKYHLYLLELNGSAIFTNSDQTSSLISIDGSFLVNNKQITELEGFHVESNFQLNLESDKKVQFLMGSSGKINFTNTESDVSNSTNLIPLSSYKVDKPWGFENWYTDNLEKPLYALKRIHMEKGFQSSLQSHEFKSETNFVIEGEALVLFGLEAPKDTGEEIIIEKLDKKIYSPYSGWSNKVNELHRVIAHTSYDAIEISTPELDDVIRWADDSNRSSGRIDTEHNI